MKKIALALAAVSIVLLASFVIVPQTSSSPGSEEHRYIVMKGITTASTQVGAFPPEFWTVPFATRPPYLTPGRMMQNITFSDPWFCPGYEWIVNLTVPAATYIGLNHTWYDSTIGLWFRLNVTMAEDGYGWIFLNATGDVDCYTFNNDTGVYWGPASPMALQLAALTGQLPSLGPDGIAGTADDGFGNGVADPPGSSILCLPATLYWDYWTGTQWALMVSTSFPMVMTTGTAYDIVIEPASLINGVNSTETGQPWEYYAGLDHPGQQVPHGHTRWNAYVTYACAWSMLNVPTVLGNLDIMYQIVEKKVREDCVIADINCDEIADFKDLYIAARAFDSEDEGPGPDGIPGTADDKPVADPNYDARADIKDPPDYITIHDVVRVALDYDFIPGYHVPDTWQGTISIVPSSPSANVGETFEVNVTVSGVTDLYLVLFCIRWNPAVLNLTEATPGDFLPHAPWPFWVHARINHTEGYLEAWTGTGLGSGPGSTGSGTVATLEFEVVGTGSSPLDLYNCSWLDSTTGQYDPGFATVQDGSFSTPCVFPVTWTWFDGTGHQFSFTANVTISGCCLVVQNFNFTRVRDVDSSTGHISFDVVSPGSPGSCNVTVPKLLMDGGFKVLINDTQVPCMLTWNKSHTFVWFSYNPGTHHIKIVGEIVTRIRSLDLLTLVDVDGNGVINILDVLAIAVRFGWQEYS